MDYTEYLKFFTALLAILNPIGAIPVFVGMTQEMPVRNAGGCPDRSDRGIHPAGYIECVRRRHSACVRHQHCIIPGRRRYFNPPDSHLDAACSASGSKHSPEEEQEAATKDNIAVVPLAIPLLAGPGSISTVIIFSNLIAGPIDWTFMLTSILLVGIVVWLALTAAIPVGKLVGRTGINIASRIMGLLLSAIAIEFIVGGLLQLMPGLAT